jgi:peptidoglycan hydrolase-like protein with peptidoglycan-binding domain
MRKAQIVSFLFVLVFILIAGVVGVNQANAVVCPAGFVCTPVSQTTVACPAGYICEPVKSTPTVITGLTYKKEDGSELKWCYSLTKNLGELDGAPGYESMGADVVALQSQLISLGYDIPSVSSGGSARGQFDDDTKNAVMKYQASKGIPSTGYVGPLTRASLNALCNVKSSVGSNGYGFWTKAYYSNGKLNIGWTNSSLNFDYYQVVLGNSFLNKEIQLGANFAKNQTSYIANIPTEFADFVKLNSKGQDAFYVKVNTIKSDSVSGYTVSTAKSELFTISPGTSPSPTPSIGATSIKVLSPNGGESYVAGSSYNIKWNDDEDAGNKDIYLISSSGQITTLVKKAFVRSSGIDGTYSYPWKVTDQIGTDQYRVKICKSDSNICDISDNLFQISVCPAGYKCNFSITSPTPTLSPTQTPAP